MANGEMVGSSAVLRRAWSRPQQGRGGARIARSAKRLHARKGAHRADAKKRLHGRIKGGPSQYPERLLRSPFSGSPGYLEGPYEIH
jgi:hypothetical protein